MAWKMLGDAAAMKIGHLLFVAACCAITSSASAQSDLSLGNFFSTGWHEPWKKFHRETGAPDMSLLRVQTNFLVQLLRMDTFLETGVSSPDVRQIEFSNATIEYALNRRFMAAIFSSHQWNESRTGDDRDGFAGGMFGRFQLIESEHSSLALNLKMALPATSLGDHSTIWSYALAGWQDLHPSGLDRTGLYWHLQHEISAGPLPGRATRNDLTYALSIARTFTDPTSSIGNLTSFLECSGKVLLDGAHEGRNYLSLTPGARFTLGGKHIFMAGADIPLGGMKPFSAIYRLTYIFNF